MPNVLIVDDNLANLLCYEHIFEDSNLKTMRAHSGSEALTILLGEKEHCVITDVSMPEMDGFELTRIITHDPAFANLPVILVTGKVFSENERLKGYHCGAIDYLHKPLTADIVGRKVKHLAWAYYRLKQLQSISDLLEKIDYLFPALLSFLADKELPQEVDKSIETITEIKNQWKDIYV